MAEGNVDTVGNAMPGQVNPVENANNAPRDPNDQTSGPTAADAAPKRQPCRLNKNVGPEMVVIGSGQFVMGSPYNEGGYTYDQGPRHKVTIVNPFAIGRCEVTVGEFRRFVREADYLTTAEQKGGCHVWNEKEKKAQQDPGANWKNPGLAQTDADPVVCVSYEDAQAYIGWLTQRTGQRYRLPSEAEWEYAARAGTTSARYWGDDPNAACEYANVLDQKAKAQFPNGTVHECDDGFVYTAPVGTFKANAFGLFDMLGNVWEWTQDCWHNNYKGAPQDGSAWTEENNGDCNRRVVRGGSLDNVPIGARSAHRLSDAAGDAGSDQGFRVVRTL